MPRRLHMGKHVQRDQRDKSDTPAILMRRTNAGYRLRSLLSRKSSRINAIICANKECAGVIAKSVVRSARLLGKSAFKPSGRPKRAKAEASGARARAQDECNYARRGGGRRRRRGGERGRVRVYNFLWGGKFHSRSFRFECATTTHAFKRDS